MMIRERLQAFIRDSFFADGFADDDSFLRCGIIDSLGVMQLVEFIEAEFGIEVSDPELVPENFDSLARVAAYVERKRSRAA